MEVATRDHLEQEDIEEAVPGSTSDREPLLLALPAFTPSSSPPSSSLSTPSSSNNTVPPEAWPGGIKAFYAWHALNLGYGLYLVAVSATLAVGLVANGGVSCQRRLNVWAALELGFCALGLFNVLWKHRRVPQLVVDRNAASSTDDVFISASRLTLADVGAIYGGMFLNAGWVVWLILGCIWTWGGSDGADAETCAPILLATCSLVLQAHLAVVGLLVAGLVGVVSVLPVLHFVRPDLFAPPSRGASKALIERTTRRSTFQPRGPADDVERQQQEEEVNHEDGVDQKSNNNNKKEEEDTSCAICLSDYVAGEQVRELGCGHVFHASCVDAWLETNKTCAACRRPIDIDQQQEEASGV